ncbi:FMN-binding negative transcriptional regulator [Rossellomorea sp. BNER]|jgi:transcriptional regulator|uniref:FMN-binding negative transcriptional regulator n=1 Tax=Rossellomorea sp. BNER TaxID=2962031 RepID=UPI003AF270CB|nr:FMN-binding negative transcriptional regulator [Rossellomorea sp. BNER]
MYIPKHFKNEEEESIFMFMEEHSFATLFSHHDGSPYATHLPLILNREKRVLTGHFARPNQQWKDIEGQEVLAVFHGPHSYISPSWYETNKAVPTWNYEVVHVYGLIELMENDDEELLLSMLEMVQKYEDQNSSYKVDEIENGFLEGMKKGVVGFKFNINKIEGKRKLSQNHSEHRQRLVIEQLEQLSSDNAGQIASLMRRNLEDK